jgi:hypothetical protein
VTWWASVVLDWLVTVKCINRIEQQGCVVCREGDRLINSSLRQEDGKMRGEVLKGQSYILLSHSYRPDEYWKTGRKAFACLHHQTSVVNAIKPRYRHADPDWSILRPGYMRLRARLSDGERIELFEPASETFWHALQGLLKMTFIQSFEGRLHMQVHA